MLGPQFTKTTHTYLHSLSQHGNASRSAWQNKNVLQLTAKLSRYQGTSVKQWRQRVLAVLTSNLLTKQKS